jgi:hypothetical protein
MELLPASNITNPNQEPAFMAVDNVATTIIGVVSCRLLAFD